MKSSKNINNIKELFLKLLPVQIFISIASNLSGLVNGLITGNYLNKDAMVALGLIMPLSMILGALGMIVSCGSGIVCGKFMGKGEAKKVNNVFSTSLIILTIFGAVLSVAIYSFSDKLAVLFGANGQIIDYTSNYIKGLSYGVIPQLTIPTCMTFLQMCNKSKVSLMLTILLAICNACYGLLNVNVFKGGIYGIGVSTSISYFSILVIIQIYLLLKKDLVVFRIKYFESDLILEILKLGSPACVANALFSIRNIFMNYYALEIQGTSAVNALTILNSLSFLDSINIGFGATITMISSVFVGERDSKSLYDLVKVGLLIGEPISIIRLVLMFLFADKVAMLFGATGEVIIQSAALLSIYTISAPLNIITQIIIGENQSLGNIVFCNVLNLVNCILSPLFCCIVLSKIIGITALYSAFFISELFAHLTAVINSAIINKKPVRSFKDLIHIPNNFEIVDKFSLSINSIDEVCEVSREVQNFCKDKGIDSKRSMLAGLCMEEMAGNVVEHGFEKDNKENTIDIFVAIENDEVTMRLRDNCVPFDPKSKLEMYSNDDPFKNVGIKMVSKISKDMNYQTTFGLNVLTIKL